MNSFEIYRIVFGSPWGVHSLLFPLENRRIRIKQLKESMAKQWSSSNVCASLFRNTDFAGGAKCFLTTVLFRWLTFRTSTISDKADVSLEEINHFPLSSWFVSTTTATCWKHELHLVKIYYFACQTHKCSFGSSLGNSIKCYKLVNH